MNKRLCKIFVLMMMMVILSVSSKVDAESNVIKELRIGLKAYNENVASIYVANKVLDMGYINNDVFISEYVFTSSEGYTFKAAKSRYLISKESFQTYDQTNGLVTMLRQQGYRAHVGTVSKGVWKVYIQVSDSNEGNAVFAKVNGKNNLTYDIVSDNGYRTMMEMMGDNVLIMENTQQHPQFLSKDNSVEAAVISLGDRQYRGRLEIGRYNDIGVTAVNVVSLKDYLCGVLPSEMRAIWPIEALKAQAVAARSYAVYFAFEVPKYPDKPYDLCDTTDTQAYKGFSIEHPNTNKAVNETVNQFIYYNDKIIPAYYFSTSGGHTENSENVWSDSKPFLKGVPDLYEFDPEKKPWIKELTSDEIKAALASHNINIGTILNVIPSGYTEAGRVINLKIIGTNGDYIIPKEAIKSWLGLLSRKFTVVTEKDVPKTTVHIKGQSSSNTGSIDSVYVMSDSNNTEKLSNDKDQLIILSQYNINSIPTKEGKANTYIFIGQGSGHGVGLSQSGAKGMALEGFTYEEILKHYYNDIDVR